MFYVYIVISAILVPLSDIFFDVLRQPYSWWLVPLLFVLFFICLVIIQLLLLFVPAMFVRLDSPPEKGARYFRFMTNITIPLLFKIFRVRIQVSGVDKVPQNGRFMLVCNHQHDFDPVVIMSVLPNAELAFIGKKEIYKEMPIIARIMHKLYGLPIDRENNREAAKTIISAANLIKQDKASVAVFPEGYSSRTGELLPLRNGVFKLAIKTGVPIVVCVINNTRSIVPNLLRRHTDVVFKVIDVLYPGDFGEMSTVDIGNIVHSKINTALEEIKAGQNK